MKQALGEGISRPLLQILCAPVSMSKLKTPTGVAGWNRFHQRANSSSCSRAQASNTTSSQQRDQTGPGQAAGGGAERPQRSTGVLRHAVAPGLVVKYQLQQQHLQRTNNIVAVAFLKHIVSLDIYYVLKLEAERSIW